MRSVIALLSCKDKPSFDWAFLLVKEKTVKRFVATVSFSLCALLCFAQAAPTFDAENAFVFDAFKIKGKAKDNIRFINSSYDDDISFFVFYFDEQNSSWSIYGTARLKGFGDTDFVDSPSEVKLNKIRYFAVVTRNEKAYEYQIKKTSDDLYIYVFSH